jgi:hypothetical protein
VASQVRSGRDWDLDTEVSKRHLNFAVVEIGTWILSSFLIIKKYFYNIFYYNFKNCNKSKSEFFKNIM